MQTSEKNKKFPKQQKSKYKTAHIHTNPKSKSKAKQFSKYDTRLISQHTPKCNY